MGREERGNRNPFKQWKQTAQPSSTQAYDRIGRLLAPGDVVHLLGKTDIMWLVRSVRPVMDPSAPPGTVELALEARFVTGVLGGRRVTDVIKVMDAEETEALNKQMQGAAPSERAPDAPPGLHVVGGDGGMNGTPQGSLADDEPRDDEPKES